MRHRTKNIDCYKNSEEKIWLNIASSHQVLENFVNIDNSLFLSASNLFRRFPLSKKLLPGKHREIIELYNRAKKKAILLRCNCKNPLPFPDGSVDHILCSHFLEHVFLCEAKKIIRNFYRVLKPEATLHIIVPDLKLQAKEYLSKSDNGEGSAADKFVKMTLLSRESKPSLKYRILEFSGSFGLQHRWMYDYLSIKEKLQESGFVVFDGNSTPSSQYRLNDGSVHVVARKA
ncbi:MAG: methyltransferase domain-containing protein [Candidatus Omnitrophota bacterium]